MLFSSFFPFLAGGGINYIFSYCLKIQPDHHGRTKIKCLAVRIWARGGNLDFSPTYNVLYRIQTLAGWLDDCLGGWLAGCLWLLGCLAAHLAAFPGSVCRLLIVLLGGLHQPKSGGGVGAKHF